MTSVDSITWDCWFLCSLQLRGWLWLRHLVRRRRMLDDHDEENRIGWDCDRWLDDVDDDGMDSSVFPGMIEADDKDGE